MLQVGGCLARLFTTLQEVDDIIVLLLYILSAFLNGILLSQFFIYPSIAIGKAKTKTKTKAQGNRDGKWQSDLVTKVLIFIRGSKLATLFTRKHETCIVCLV